MRHERDPIVTEVGSQFIDITSETVERVRLRRRRR
jgi:hypothetical protein